MTIIARTGKIGSGNTNEGISLPNMLIRELDRVNTMAGGSVGAAVMQLHIRVNPDAHGHYAVAIHPRKTSAYWYFAAADGSVWLNGKGGQSDIAHCIALYPTIEKARQALVAVHESHPDATRLAIFRCELTQAGDLLLKKHEERRGSEQVKFLFVRPA